MPTANEILEGIRNDVLNFDIYRIYRRPDSRTKYWPVIITYGNFFSTSLRAQFAAMVAALGRVFDNDSRNISIETLLKAEPNLQKVDPGNLVKARDLWKLKAKTLRHQIVAHHAGFVSPQEVFKRENISLDDIEELISVCEKLVDAWTRHAGCHVDILENVESDTFAMLEALRSSVPGEDKPQ